MTEESGVFGLAPVAGVPPGRLPLWDLCEQVRAEGATPPGEWRRIWWGHNSTRLKSLAKQARRRYGPPARQGFRFKEWHLQHEDHKLDVLLVRYEPDRIDA